MDPDVERLLLLADDADAPLADRLRAAELWGMAAEYLGAGTVAHGLGRVFAHHPELHEALASHSASPVVLAFCLESPATGAEVVRRSADVATRRRAAGDPDRTLFDALGHRRDLPADLLAGSSALADRR